MRKIYNIFSFILILTILTLIQCEFGVSTISNRIYSTTTFQCIRQSGRNVADVVIFARYTGYNATYAQNLYNIKNAGMRAQLWVSPCRSLDPITDARELLSKFNRLYYDRIWISPDGNLDQKCTWIGTSYTPQQNCQYLRQYIQQIRFAYTAVGVSTNSHKWQTIFKDKCNYTISQYLYWTPQNPNQKPNFNDFKEFAGWSKPNVKLYQQAATVCGVDVDLRYS